jgi:hypothetical protein
VLEESNKNLEHDEVVNDEKEEKGVYDICGVVGGVPGSIMGPGACASGSFKASKGRSSKVGNRRASALAARRGAETRDGDVKPFQSRAFAEKDEEKRKGDKRRKE